MVRKYLLWQPYLKVDLTCSWPESKADFLGSESVDFLKNFSTLGFLPAFPSEQVLQFPTCGMIYILASLCQWPYHKGAHMWSTLNCSRYPCMLWHLNLQARKWNLLFLLLSHSSWLHSASWMLHMNARLQTTAFLNSKESCQTLSMPLG